MNEKCHFNSIRNSSIGSILSVSSREWRVILEQDAPHSTAINTGIPTLFPKINGYVLVPNETGAIIGMITWIGIENSPYPKRRGFRDFDLVDLPYPQRIMSLNPIGELKIRKNKLCIERGVYNYPSVGDIVILPNNEQLQAIVEKSDPNACVHIGYAPAAANSPVFINPDKLFGRHLAVLGNTGSGKSTSIAGIIRWSIEEAKKVNPNITNARFIILDPNGEYSSAFDELNCSVRKYQVNYDNQIIGFKQLHVPVWLWNSFEWSSIVEATEKIQRPLLRQALRDVKNSGKNDTISEIESPQYFLNLLRLLKTILKGAPESCSHEKQKIGDLFSSVLMDLENYEKNETDNFKKGKFSEIFSYLSKIMNNKNPPFYAPFHKKQIEDLIQLINPLISLDFPTLTQGPDEDTPIPFDVKELPNLIESLATEQKSRQYIDHFIMRIQTMLSDTRMSSIIGTDVSISLKEWLDSYIGNNSNNNAEITVIDLSLVPTDVLHLIVAVISRVIFEAHQRYRRHFNNELPTVLVLDEAHIFINKDVNHSNQINPQYLCNNIYEKIAREGRKFGIGLLISSQRPAELSPTVLSQCNTFLLHRLVNDKDQELVRKFLPDNLGNLLSELPVLPTKKAILLGWASPIPIFLEIRDLEKKFRPKASNPQFWDVWINNEKRIIDWEIIEQEWQKR